MGKNSARAFDIVSALGLLDDFPKIIGDFYEGKGDITSCNQTARYIGEVWGGATTSKKEKVFDVRDHDAMLTEMKSAFADDLIVYVGMTPDHHFILYPNNDNTKLNIVQSFQGVYDLPTWLRCNRYTLLPKNFYIDLLALFGSSREASVEAAVRLFSIEGKKEKIKEWVLNAPCVKPITCYPFDPLRRAR